MNRTGLTVWLYCLVVCVRFVAGQLKFPLLVNFGPEEYTCGYNNRYIQDSGAPFRLKEDGLVYGWRKAESPNEPTRTGVRYRNIEQFGCVARSFAFMERINRFTFSIEDVSWQISNVPNGVYTIEALVGDVKRKGSVHSISANGQVLMAPTVQEFEGQRIEAKGAILVRQGFIRISAEAGTNTKISLLKITEGGILSRPKPGFVPKELLFNFRPEGSRSCGRRYTSDHGLPFGLRPDGVEYGWLSALDGTPVDISNATVLRDVPQCVFGSFIAMQQLGNPPAVFRINGMQNGMYRVFAKCGDALGLDSTHLLEANGVRIVGPAVPAFEGEQIIGEGTVTVDDGTLTVSAENGGLNTKLAELGFSKVLTSPSPTPPGATPKPIPEDCLPFPSEFNGKVISLDRCETVVRQAPFRMSFRGRQGGVVDSNGVPTGFTMFLPSKGRPNYYDSDLLTVITDRGLAMKARRDRMDNGRNRHVNMLGVGLNVPGSAFSISISFILPTNIFRWNERACLFFGISDSNFVQLCVVTQGGGYGVKLRVEESDKPIFLKNEQVELGEDRTVNLFLQILPETAEVAASYSTTGDVKDLVRTMVPRELFSFDAANQDFRLGTRSFVGVVVASNNIFSASEFILTKFDMIEIDFADVGQLTPGIDWSTNFINNVPFPTALVFGPDDKLYVVNADCDLFRITFNANGFTEASRESFKPLGSRLCLGIDIDPASTPDNVVLWVSHSDSAQDDGEANSGKVSRLSGEGFSFADTIIEGLPRAIANHAPNQLHFGPNGLLYLAIGGNTGGGAPNPQSPTFGFRPEQCLSAAILVANVTKPGFLGNCTPTQNPDEMDASGIALDECENLCDVQTYATGLRNSYDFTWRKGAMFATDNGLGGTGTAPLLSADYVEGDTCAMPVSEEQISLVDPGVRDDLLQKVEEGKYYGHPVPVRRECVYFGGNPTPGLDFSVPRLPLFEGKMYPLETKIYAPGSRPTQSNYAPPFLSLGRSRSANGIITYKSDAFCGQLKDDLLVTWYSQLDQVLWLHLNEAGTAVLNDEPLRRSRLATGAVQSMSNPLALTQNDRGFLFVAEFSGARLRVFRPIGNGCTTRTASVAESGHLSDAGAAVVAERDIYVFGGVHYDGDSKEAFVFHTRTDLWEKLKDLPSPASAIAVHVNDDHKELYLVGGFTNGVGLSTVRRYHDGYYHPMPPLLRPRGGATVIKFAKDSMLLAGGAESEDGEAQRSTFNFDFASQAWSENASMIEGRKFAATAVVLSGKAYVCGGIGVSGEDLKSCEYYDGRKWTRIADMPTPRSRANAYSAGVKLVIQGGEHKQSLLEDIIEYDPRMNAWTIIAKIRVARSGGVGTRIGHRIYSFGGRTNDMERTRFAEIFEYKQ